MTREVRHSYSILELETDASLEQVKTAYRTQVKLWHPDRFPEDARLQLKAQEKLRELNLAYETIKEFLLYEPAHAYRRPSSPTSPQKKKEQGWERPKWKGRRTDEPPRPPRSGTQPGSEWKFTRALGAITAGVLLLIVGVLLSRSHFSSSTKELGEKSIRGKFNPSNLGGSSPPVTFSRALDETNGFRDFKFGMTPEEVRDVLPPSDEKENRRINVTTFRYMATPANRIGEFLTDVLTLNFFQGRLYRIDFGFSTHPDEIFEAFKKSFGEPFDINITKTGNQPSLGKSWRGQKVSASILSTNGTTWDSAVIQDTEKNQIAENYPAKEPERAGKDFGPTGFKSLVFGMKVQDLTVEVEPVETAEANPIAAIKKITFKNGDWQRVGFYPLKSVTAEFFHEKLYRIDLGFEENPKAMSETFKHRFGLMQEDDTWMRGSMKLKARIARSDKVIAFILGPTTGDANSDPWDSIVLLDAAVWRQAEQAKKDAAKESEKGN